MKYILKKEYPGSPKLGNIIDNLENDWIENYPEFWEEVVVEKDYEILSLVASEKNPQHKKGSKFLHNKDYKFKNMHPTEFWDIYSVKRISDNKIFTIGDFYEDLIIEKMIMSVDGNILTTYKPKAKQPLFTTEDGVDIYEGDKLYTVDKKTIKLYSNGNFAGIFTTKHNDYVYFSTKEKAEEYILMNKPVLSLNDINFAISKINNPEEKRNKLKTLVKLKIQQSV